MENEMEYPEWRAAVLKILKDEHSMDPNGQEWDYTPDFFKDYWESGFTPRGAVEEDFYQA